MISSKVFMTSNMITYTHFIFLVFRISNLILHINIDQQYYKSSNRSILFWIKTE